MPRPNLGAEARRYADSLTTLLNQTVCDHARVGVVVRPDGKLALIGTNIDGATYLAGPVRLRTAPHAYCWLTINSRYYLDSDGYLTALGSAYVFSTGVDAEHVLFHYDYERDKPGYTEAHVQVEAHSEPLTELLTAVGRRRTNLAALHLPVGGRRFRPALEDILEALMDERIVIGSAMSSTVLTQSRDDFRRRQLRAAIRRDPDVAVVALEALGYDVKPPAKSNVLEMFSRRRRCS